MIKFDLILKNGNCLIKNPTHGEFLKIETLDVGILSGKIVEISSHLSAQESQEVIDLRGLHLLPGVIDTQVHFREPGLTAKEDFESGTRAAIMGGVTTVFDMPNTKPSTTTAKLYHEKYNLIQKKSHCDFGLFFGASAENSDETGKSDQLPSCCGIKIFMGSSTGSLLVSEDELIESHFKNVKHSPIFAIHAEDEKILNERRALLEAKLTSSKNPVSLHPWWRNEQSAFNATQRILKLSQKWNQKIHILHISTAEEVAFLFKHKTELTTLEVLPQHLFFAAPECYEKWGPQVQQNPPIREARHREALWKGVQEGLFDIIGSDHAPHTLEDKNKPYPFSSSGMPGVQTLVPLMLNFVNQKKLSLERFTEMVTENPRRIYGIQNKGRIDVGFDADFTVVDLKKEKTIEETWLQSRCGWSPYSGMKVQGWVTMTFLRGKKVMADDQILSSPTGLGVLLNGFTKR